MPIDQNNMTTILDCLIAALETPLERRPYQST